MPNLRPLFDNVLVQEIEHDRAIGGVLLPDVTREDMKLGKVIGTGRDCREVKLGDLVTFGPHAGMLYQIAGAEFLLMKEPEIKSVIEAEADDSGVKGNS